MNYVIIVIGIISVIALVLSLRKSNNEKSESNEQLQKELDTVKTIVNRHEKILRNSKP